MNRGMKRVLLGSTAIVGLGLLLPAEVFAAEPVSLSIGGYARVEAWIVDQEDTSGFGARGYHMETDDAEVYWTATGEADNGLKYRADLQLDMDAGAVDEVWLRFQGAWGQLELGDNDGVEDVMEFEGTAALSGQGGYDGGLGSVFDFNAVRVSGTGLVGNTSDATKISYFTPRINSVQAGVSFTPDTGHFLAAALSDGDAGDREDSIAFGINSVNSFDDVNVNVSFTAVFADPETGATHPDESWAIGGNISFGGFTLGASHNEMGDSGVATPADGSDGGKYWEIAGGYSAGDYSIGIGYFRGEAGNATGTTDDETRIFTIGANYNMAPGLRVYAEFDDIDIDQPGVGPGIDNDGQLFMIGTNISF